MSKFFKDNFESINEIKSQKEIILQKIHRIKSYNDNIVKENSPFKKNNNTINNQISPYNPHSNEILYDSNQGSMVTKVFMKPLVKKNNLIIKNNEHKENKRSLISSLNFSKIQKKLNKNNDKSDINNNIINNNFINLENKRTINNHNSLNEEIVNYEVESISKFHNNNNTINNHTDNNPINNICSIRNEKIKNKKNGNMKKSSEFNRICLKNNNNININILEKVNTSKAKDININSINLISNNNISNNPLYFSKIFSLSKTINEVDTINNTPETIQTDYNDNQKIKKKLKSKLFLNDKNIETFKTTEEVPLSNYYSSVTEVSPTFKKDEFEINSKNTKNENQFDKINYIKTKREILTTIEKEKEKIINESLINYRKYLYLIHKQQHEYEEYDKYLKKELNNNRNNKIKLQLFKNKLQLSSTNSSYLNTSKNKNFIKGGILTSTRIKTLSSKNFDIKKRNQMKKNILSNKSAYNEKRILTNSDVYESMLNEDSKFNYLNTNNDLDIIKPKNKKILKINIENIKKYKKQDITHKNNNLKNKIFNKVKHQNYSEKNLYSNYFSSKSLQKSKLHIKSKYEKNHKNYNTQINNFINESKNKLNIKNSKNILILKKLMDKNTSNSKNKETFSQNTYKILKTIPINENLRCNSLKKMEKSNDIEADISSKIHKVISLEKKKILNKLNTNIYKLKENTNNKSSKGPNKNTLGFGRKTKFNKIKNGFSSFKSNNIKDININNKCDKIII